MIKFNLYNFYNFFLYRKKVYSLETILFDKCSIKLKIKYKLKIIDIFIFNKNKNKKIEKLIFCKFIYISYFLKWID